MVNPNDSEQPDSVTTTASPSTPPTHPSSEHNNHHRLHLPHLPHVQTADDSPHTRIDLQMLGLTSIPHQNPTTSATPTSSVDNPTPPTQAPRTQSYALSRKLSEDYPVQPAPPRKASSTFISTLRTNPSAVPTTVVHLATSFARRFYPMALTLLFFAFGLAMLGIFAFDPIEWRAWVTFAVVCTSIVVLVFSLLPTPIVMLLAALILMLSTVISPEEALLGFSNEGIASVTVLFIVAEGVQRTSLLLPLFRVMLGKPTKLWLAQIRLLFPVALLSSFLYNTPTIAIAAPIVNSWSRRAGFPISKLYMPLNHAAALGGTMTLLGTSTNIVIKGLVEGSGIPDLNGQPIRLSIFELTKVGIIYLAVGMLYLIISSCFLIRVRNTGGVNAMIKNPREYTVALRVTAKSPIVGETVVGAGLRQLDGLFLIEITRADGTTIPAVAPETVIQKDDTLLFAGIVDTVKELYTDIPGLIPATTQTEKIPHAFHERRLVEVVISPSSFLNNKTAKSVRFRSRFNAAIIAVHRHGEHVKERIGDIRLDAGDTLLIECGSDFVKAYKSDSNFALVSEVSGSQPPRANLPHMITSAAIVIGMISIVTAGELTLFEAASAAAVLMVVTRCVSLENAIRSINLGVVVAVAASFAMSKAMDVSGAAEALATFIVNTLKRFGNVGLLFGIYLSAALLTSVLTNNATATLLWAIVKSILIAETTLNPYAAIYALLFGASASFTTPIAYNTNIMLHPGGGYTFMDWVFYGTPLVLILAPVVVFSINLFFPSQ